MKEISHYVIIRFYNENWGYYSKEILTSEKFLNDAKDLLISNCFASLENQTNKDFEVILLINDYLNDNHPIINSLNSIKSSFKIHIVKSKDLEKILKSEDSKYLITSRIDIDDFAKKDAVEEIQTFAKNLNNIPYTIYGYGNGIALVGKDISTAKEYLPGYIEKGPMSIMVSLIIDRRISKSIIDVYELKNHSKIKLALIDLYENENIPFNEKAYHINKEKLSYLYIKTGNNVSLMTNPNKNWGDDKYKVIKEKEWYKNKFGLI